MLYTYCKESLKYKKVIPTRNHGLITLAVMFLTYVMITGMVAAAKEEGFNEAIAIPSESELVILESDEDVFSQEALVEELKRLNVRYPHIVLAQAILETGFYDSRIYHENHNLFGYERGESQSYYSSRYTIRSCIL